MTNLAGRLEAADTRGEGREAVVRDVHLQLQVLIRERLYAKHGIIAEEEPKWAAGSHATGPLGPARRAPAA